jgi:NADH-quinone oxidoreductase subunit L
MTLIIIFLPLFTAVLSGFLGRLIGQKGSMFITTLGMVITMVISFYFFYSNLIGVPTYLVLGK